MLSNREDLPGLESSTRFPQFRSSSSYPLLKMHQYLVVPLSNLRDSAQNDNKEIEISSLSTFRSNSNCPDSRQQFSADHMAQQPQTLITGKRGERGEYFCYYVFVQINGQRANKIRKFHLNDRFCGGNLLFVDKNLSFAFNFEEATLQFLPSPTM